MELVPFRRRRQTGLANIHDQIDDMFTRFIEGWPSPVYQSGGWWPPVDVAESEDSVTVKAEMPGIEPDEIELSVHDNTLTITGEKKEATEQNEGNYYHVERRYGSFRRDVSLPGTVDAEKIEASCKEGILCVKLPKIEAAKPKRIKIEK